MCFGDGVGDRAEGSCDISGKNILSSCNVVVDLLVITNYCVDVRVSDKS